MKHIFSIILFFLYVGDLSGQADTSGHQSDSIPDRAYLLHQVDRDGEILPEIDIKEVTVVGRPETIKRSWYRKYDRLVYNLKIVYPYAVLVRGKLGDVNEKLEGLPTDRERKQYMKEVEKEVFGEYEDDMRNMTITQGRLLIKLIDRETQNTSYELIQQYRGSLSAIFWQAIARIFGTNLKENYDPYGNDILIELIILEIEAGLL